MLTPDDQHLLLTLARAALEARVRRQAPPPVPRGASLDVPCDAFVTIHHRGQLRGCLGCVHSKMSLADTVAHLAAVVADSDSRFTPVEPHELADISLEISALTPEREVTDIAEIEVGRHGLTIELGSRRGLLLPQVAVEHGWDRETFLEHTCVKAGLPPTAWRTGARIRCFEAQVFGEEKG